MSLPSVADVAAELAATFGSQLLNPADARYEEARKVHNGLVDKRPALIARCGGVADVVDAVNIAEKLGLQAAVRGGGHNVAGRATIDGGVMIDLAPMKGIHVDPKIRTASVQGGVTWAELNRETQLHGLAVTGGVVSSTGVAGLTLGGGIGWLMGKCPSTSSRHKARYCGQAKKTNPICSGPFAVEAATSVWPPPSNFSCIRLGLWSRAA
jgi:FAD/FMN-containing dehydrogenase